MTDPAPAAETAAPDATAPEPDTDPQAAQPADVDWKAKAREWEKRAKANADAAKKLAQLQDAGKTDQQRTAEELDAARAEASQATAALLRHEVAADKDIPAKLVRFLTGSTRDEIEESADALLAALPQPARGPGRPVESLRSGATPATQEPPADVDAWIRRAVAARSHG